MTAGSQTLYLDASTGNDANNGSTPQTAVKTVARLLSIGIRSGTTINIARGSVFREFLNLGAPGLSNITLRDYGTGARPVFDAADTALNASFTKVAGSQRLYQVSWKNDFRDYSDVSQYSVWENGQRMKRVKTQAECEQTPGSYFAGKPTQPTGTDPILLHASDGSDITSNNKLYEITRRSMGVQVGDSCVVYNLHTRRNGSNDGSFKSGLQSYLYRVLAEDGVKHNFFMASGVAENCMVWKADDPIEFGGSTMFISYTDSPRADTMNLIYKNCVVIAGMNGNGVLQGGIIGVYAHTGSVPYNSLQITGGVFAHTATAVSSEIKNLYIDSAFFMDNTVVSSKLSGNLQVRNSHIILNNSASAAGIAEDRVLDSVYFVNNKVWMPAGEQIAAKLVNGAPAYVQFSNNTIFSNNTNTNYLLFYYAGGGTVEMKNNLAANLGGGSLLAFRSNDAFANTRILAESNHYSTTPAANNMSKVAWATGNSSLGNLQAIKNTGYEVSSTEEPASVLRSRITGTYATTDFFLPKTDVLFGKNGSTYTFDGIERYPHWLGDTLGVTPVDILPEIDTVFNFTVKPGLKGNELNWDVEGIDSVDHYEVEFGNDTTNLVVLTRIPQEQNKDNYSYVHEPKNAGDNYYRIVVVSKNQVRNYSKEIMVPAAALSGMTAGPNPVQDVLHIQVSPANPLQLTLLMTTMDGRKVLLLYKQLSAGRQTVDVDLRALQPGIYNLQVKTGFENRVFRILKQ